MKKETMQEEYLAKMKGDSDRRMGVIAEYFEFKGYEFDNEDQIKASLKRNLRASKPLVGYNNEDLVDTMDYLDSLSHAGLLQKWTLETVSKYINDVRSGNV